MSAVALVLAYHGLSESWPAPLAVRPGAFEAQLEYLLSRGYEGTTFGEIVAARPARKQFAVTFDDAYRSVISIGLPILSRLGIPASVFAPTLYIGSEEPMSWPGIEQWRSTPHERELIPMSWQELERLADLGWEIGSHTRSHPRLTSLADAELRDELQSSRAECERRLGRPCGALAYPYGDHDQRVVRAAAAAGYSAAATLPARLHRAVPLRWPRVGIYRVDDERRFRTKASPLVRRLRATPIWAALGGLRSRVGTARPAGETGPAS